jgi:uncharacterized protein YegL
MNKFCKSLSNLCAATAIAASVTAVAPASAAVIELGFILDSSGSIGVSNWGIITNGLANAINTLIPVGGVNTYEISVVKFDDTASTLVNHVLITDSTVRTSVANTVGATSFLGGTTSFAAAFTAMRTALTTSPNYNAGLAQYVNLATDGQPNTGGSGVTQRNALIAAGVDNISIEAIGTGVNASFLQGSICFPQPCDTTSPFNFPAQGFYIGVANAQGYANAIGNKIAVVTGQTVPEPGTIVLLVAGLLGVTATVCRRRVA